MIERQKQLYLCRPDGTLLAQLNGVQTENVEYSVRAKDYNEINFPVDRFINVDGEMVQSGGYDDLHVGMHVLLEGSDMFEIQEPSISYEDQKEYKTVHGFSLEREFQDKDFLGLKINTGERDSQEYLIDGNIDDFGFAIKYFTFYKSNNSGETDFSIIHFILKKMPGWSVDDNDIDGNLWDKRVSISEDNINCYGLLTSVIAPKIEAIILFDTINKKIKAISKESLDENYYDTSIFVSMRNLVQKIDVQTDEDSVYTVFNVRGDEDLNINAVNYGDSYVYDLSYFLSEPWMSSSTANKIKAWDEWRNFNREQFISWSKQVEERDNKIYDVTYCAQNDGDDWHQWDGMDIKSLNESKEVYDSYILALRKDADDDPSFDVNGDYIVRTKSGGAIDEEYYEQQLHDNSKGYYTYIEIRDYILPNIQIAIQNNGIPEDQKLDYVEDYETNWELYGIETLKGKEESYEKNKESIKEYAKAWEELTEVEKARYIGQEAQYNVKHSEYVKYDTYLGSYNQATGKYTPGSLREKLHNLMDYVDALNAEIDALNAYIDEYKEMAKISHSNWEMTDSELLLFNTLCRYTDYTNTNILTTSIDDTVTSFDDRLELYEDAVSKLSEVSQPQYSFSVDMDNFFDIPEFESWKDKFKLLRFMRVALRDDYFVKLRLVGYTTNPCEIDSMLSVEFSNFITSKSGRTDLTELLELGNNSGSKNSISVGTNGAQTAEEYAQNLFYMLSRSGILSSTNARNSSTVSATSTAFSGISTANLVRLYSTTGYITDATMSEVKVTDFIDAVKVNAATVQAGTIIADRILLKGTASGLIYQLNNTGGLVSERVESLDGYVLTERTISADKIIANSITANEITANNLIGTHGWINLHDGTFWYGGTGTSQGMSWDGTNLDISGGINADHGNIGGYVISSSTNNGTTANGGHTFMSSLYAQSKNNTYEYEVGMTSGITDSGTGWKLPDQYAFYVTRINNGNAWIPSNRTDVFWIKHNGDLYAQNADITGNVNATTGSIGDATNKIFISSDATNAAIYNGVTSVSDTSHNGFYLGTDGIVLGKGVFKVTSDGALYAQNADITGTLKAGADSKIGPWNVTSTSIYKMSATMGSSTTGAAYFGNDGLSITDKFKVSAAGALTATSGNIAGWTITPSNGSTDGRIYKEVTAANSVDGKNFYIGMRSDPYDPAQLNVTNGNPYNPVFWVRYDNVLKFFVRSNGYLRATDAEITGTITANTGKIGGANGWTIAANKISSGTLGSNNSFYMGTADLGTATIAEKNASTWRLAVGSNFGVTSDGALYAKNAVIKGSVTATTGQIGGWDISTTELKNGTPGTSGALLSPGGYAISVASGNISQKYENFLSSIYGARYSAQASHTWRFAVNNAFGVKNDGTTYLSSLYCNGGILGGWKITSNGIHCDFNTSNTPTTNAYSGMSSIGYAFYAGETNSKYGGSDSDAKIYITQEGQLVSRNISSNQQVQIYHGAVGASWGSASSSLGPYGVGSLVLGQNNSIEYQSNYAYDHMEIIGPTHYVNMYATSGNIGMTGSINVEGRSSSWLNSKTGAAIVLGRSTGTTGFSPLASVAGVNGKWVHGVLESNDSYSFAYLLNSRTTNGTDAIISFGSTGTVSAVSFQATGAITAASLSTTGNISSTAGTLSAASLSVSGAISAASLTTSGNISVNGTINGASISTTGNISSSGTITATNFNGYVKNYNGNYRTAVTTVTEDGRHVSALQMRSPTKAQINGQNGTAGSSTDWYDITISGSDRRLKKNISDSQIDALSLVKEIKLHSFDWKHDNSHWNVGFIADEVYEIDPNLANKPDDEKSGYWSINDFYLAGVLTKAIQEEDSKFEKLKDENEKLKSRIQALEDIIERRGL